MLNARHGQGPSICHVMMSQLKAGTVAPPGFVPPGLAHGIWLAMPQTDALKAHVTS
jgi:hypothetical protein